MTEKEIYKIIETDTKPFWFLYVDKAYQAAESKGAFDPSAVPKDGDAIKASIKQLADRLNLLGAGHYGISIAKTAQANQSGKMYFDFSYNVASLDNSQAQTHGIGNIDFDALGYVPKTYVAEKEKMQQERFELMMDKKLLELKKADFEAELKERQKELREAQRKADDSAEIVRLGLGKAANQLIKIFASSDNPLNGTAELGEPQSERQDEPDERENAANELATDIYNKGLSANEIKFFHNQINTFIQQQKQKNNAENRSTEIENETAD